MDGPADQPKPKVLMLDDELFLLELYKKPFEKAGYDVATYYDAEQALGILRDGYEPAAILFDITMPGKSGYEFIEDVHKEGLAKNSIKIALTNESREATKDRLLELGTDAFLYKAEFVPSELEATVTKMLKDREAVSGMRRV